MVRGNEGTERSGVHDEEQWTKDRALGDTAGGCVPGGQVGFTFDTEAARWQIWLEPAENRATDTKPGWEMGDQDVMVNSIRNDVLGRGLYIPRERGNFGGISGPIVKYKEYPTGAKVIR